MDIAFRTLEIEQLPKVLLNRLDKIVDIWRMIKSKSVHSKLLSQQELMELENEIKESMKFVNEQYKEMVLHLKTKYANTNNFKSLLDSIHSMKDIYFKKLRNLLIDISNKNNDLKRNQLKTSDSYSLKFRSPQIDENLLKTSLAMVEKEMAYEVEQSLQILPNLASTSNSLATIHSDYNNSYVAASNGQNLIKKFDKRQFTDTILLGLGIILFILAVFYVISKRIFPGLYYSNTN